MKSVALGRTNYFTDEEIAALQKERNAFFEQTRDLRDKLYQKGLELRAEMAKQNPDASKAAGLQKEVSGLHSDLAAKRLVLTQSGMGMMGGSLGFLINGRAFDMSRVDLVSTLGEVEGALPPPAGS